jgi:hypothetical protein
MGAPSNCRSEPEFLGPFEGILQTDGYGAYDHVGGPKVVHGACWAHYPGSGVIQSGCVGAA